jgi:hypothetical protein
VAISAGVTLGASVAVLSTDGSSVPQVSGLIVPQSQPGGDSEVHATQPSPPGPVTPPVVEVVTVTAAGYTQSLTPPPPPPSPVLAVNVGISVKPLPLVRNVVRRTINPVLNNPATSIVSQILGGSSSSGFGWFGTSSVSRQSSNSLSTFAVQQDSGGRHQAAGGGSGRDGGGRHRSGGGHR